MRKNALLCVMLALVLLLSGCALVQKDEAVDNATEILRLGDKVITKEMVKAQTESQLYNMYSAYSMIGYSYDVTDPENIAKAQDAAIEAYEKDLALTAKAAELGLDKLTDEETEEAKTAGQENFDSDIEFYIKNYMTDTEGVDEETLKTKAREELEAMGYSVDDYITSATKKKVDAKLKEYAIKDVTVTDEEIQEDFDAKVESDKTTYAENPGSWAVAANNGTTLYYTPAGVRRVKQILTKFTEEDQKAIDEANQQMSDANTARSTAQAKIDAANSTLDELKEGDSDEIKSAREAAEATLAEAQKELDEADNALMTATEALTAAQDKAFADIDEKVDAILASLDAEGADWNAIMEANNEDPGMKDNEKGYAVATGMSNFDPAFVEAAMALEKIGDHSGKVKGTQYGYYIIRYESDEAEGPIALDDVKESITSALLSQKQEDTYDETVAKWVEEAGIKVDLNALKD